MPYKDPETGRRKARERYYQDPTRAKENNRRWRAANKDKSLQYSLAPYGLSVTQYENMLTQQGGRCALCFTETPGGKGRWHVDHSHDTGTVRGLLCSSCNVALGLFKDDTRVLARAIDYLGTT